MKKPQQRFILASLFLTLFSTHSYGDIAGIYMGATAGIMQNFTAKVKNDDDREFVYTGPRAGVHLGAVLKEGGAVGAYIDRLLLENTFEIEGDSEEDDGESITTTLVGVEGIFRAKNFPAFELNAGLAFALGQFAQKYGEIEKNHTYTGFHGKFGATVSPSMANISFPISVVGEFLGFSSGKDEDDADTVLREISGAAYSALAGVRLNF